MKQPWLNHTLPIAALFSFRMLGLFMLIPVFTVYAVHLKDATPMLLGMALGCYGLSQGMLQIPFGMLSDRYGRKPIITLGLLLFALGSLFGAYTHSIYGMIFARILQGAGAIGSVLIALLADVTPDEQRTKAMAVIGVTIGLSFSLAIVVSPFITHYFGLSGIFYLTALFAMLGLCMLYTLIPTPHKEPEAIKAKITAAQFIEVLKNPHLQRLDIGIFFQHAILISTFFAIPMLLQQHMKLGHLSAQWHFYLPLMLTSFLVMIPCIIIAEKKHQTKPFFIASVGLIMVSQFALAYTYASFLSLCGLMFVYFSAFNLLEASLPSLVSKQASANSKGCAMGIYSSSQFLGIFVGGSLAGILFQYVGLKGIFITNGIIAAGWVIISAYMQPMQYQYSLTILCDKPIHAHDEIRHRLSMLQGVNHVTVSTESNAIYLCVEKALYQNGSAESVLLTVQ